MPLRRVLFIYVWIVVVVVVAAAAAVVVVVAAAAAVVVVVVVNKSSSPLPFDFCRIFLGPRLQHVLQPLLRACHIFSSNPGVD